MVHSWAEFVNFTPSAIRRKEDLFEAPVEYTSQQSSIRSSAVIDFLSTEELCQDCDLVPRPHAINKRYVMATNLSSLIICYYYVFAKALRTGDCSVVGLNSALIACPGGSIGRGSRPSAGMFRFPADRSEQRYSLGSRRVRLAACRLLERMCSWRPPRDVSLVRYTVCALYAVPAPPPR